MVDMAAFEEQMSDVRACGRIEERSRRCTQHEAIGAFRNVWPFEVSNSVPTGGTSTPGAHFDINALGTITGSDRTYRISDCFLGVFPPQTRSGVAGDGQRERGEQHCQQNANAGTFQLRRT